MRQKTGRKLLGFLLTLAMVFGLLLGAGLTAYAGEDLTSGEPTSTYRIDVKDVAYNNTRNFAAAATLPYNLDATSTIHSLNYKSQSVLSVSVTSGTNVTVSGQTITVTDEGTATVAIVMKPADDSAKTKYFDLIVTKNVPVTDVTLDPTSTTLTVGDSRALTATVVPEDAADKKVIWSVSGTNAGAVKLYTDEACTTEVGSNATSTRTVYAKGISVGLATVTATSNADGSKSTSCSVSVVDNLSFTSSTNSYGMLTNDSASLVDVNVEQNGSTVAVTNKDNVPIPYSTGNTECWNPEDQSGYYIALLMKISGTIPDNAKLLLNGHNRPLAVRDCLDTGKSDEITLVLIVGPGRRAFL